jgi:GTPase SAR1 family protein
MNITNADYFTFNVDSSLFIAGQTGSGKSYLVHSIINRKQSALRPDEIKFVLFDLKQVEFGDTNPEYLLYDVVIDPDEGLNKLDELADLSIERANNHIKKPMIFIYIEECDMACVDQKRFDKAIITINKHAFRANMKLVYSTSRPTPDVVSTDILNSFDLVAAGKLASVIDANHLCVPFSDWGDKYSFILAQKDERYKPDGTPIEFVNVSDLNIQFGGDYPPQDKHLTALLGKAYNNEIKCRKAIVNIDLIKPFSNYKPKITKDYATQFIERYQQNSPPELYVYEKDGKFIMSDDYFAYYMYKEVEVTVAICVVIGASKITEDVEYGPWFNLSLPNLEVPDKK